MRMWIGKEKEGKFKGKQTLFIGDKSITLDDIKEASQYQMFEQIYFGAGVCSKINETLLNQVVKLYPKYIITAEVDYKQLKKLSMETIQNYNINFILTITDDSFAIIKNKPKSKINIKIQSLNKDNNYLAIGNLENFIVTDLTGLLGKTYKGDKVLK